MLKYYHVKSCKIACWTSRNDFDEQAQSLFFIHGSGGDHTLWSFQYAHLGKKFAVVAVDLPGHGGSEGSGESEIHAYSLWLKKLLDVLPLRNLVMIGHSLGAAIVLDFAAEFGSMLRGVVPVGGGLKMPVNPAIFELLKTEPETAFELMCKFSLAKENRARFAGPLKKSLSGAKVEVLQGDLVACDQMDLTDKVKKIKLPSLVICGAEDKMTPASLSREIAASIGGSKTCFIEGAGHMVMMEKPQEFNEALIAFVQALPLQRI